MKSLQLIRPWHRFLLLPVALLSMSLAAQSVAWDNATFGAWQRTWHGPNALAMPLQAYYIPRSPGYCGIYEGTYTAGWVRAEAGCACTPVEIALDPVRFERLGRIPNDFAVVGGLGGAVATGTGR
jgi:hypothetical protein